jgi:hypothetical protein
MSKSNLRRAQSWQTDGARPFKPSAQPSAAAPRITSPLVCRNSGRIRRRSMPAIRSPLPTFPRNPPMRRLLSGSRHSGSRSRQRRTMTTRRARTWSNCATTPTFGLALWSSGKKNGTWPRARERALADARDHANVLMKELATDRAELRARRAHRRPRNSTRETPAPTCDRHRARDCEEPGVCSEETATTDSSKSRETNQA